jgi:hypothetical protein
MITHRIKILRSLKRRRHLNHLAKCITNPHLEQKIYFLKEKYQGLPNKLQQRKRDKSLTSRRALAFKRYGFTELLWSSTSFAASFNPS